MKELGKLEKLLETLPPSKHSEKLVSPENEEQKAMSKSNPIKRYFEEMRVGGTKQGNILIHYEIYVREISPKLAKTITYSFTVS